MSKSLRYAIGATSIALVFACAQLQPQGFSYVAPILPEGASGYQVKPGGTDCNQLSRETS